MQHIMQIAFDFDDERVRSVAENKIDQNMDNIIKDIVTDRIAPFTTNYYSRSGKTRDWSELDRMVEDHVNSIIDDHKDEIIQKAAEMLFESYKRTKAWKEKANDIIA